MFVRLRRDYKSYLKGSVLNLPDDEALDLLKTRGAYRAESGDSMYEKDLSGSFLSRKGPRGRKINSRTTADKNAK